MPGSSGHFFDTNSFEHLQPRTLVLVIGVLAAVVNIFFGPTLDGTFVLFLAPAAIMAVVLLGGGVAGAICAAIAMLAGLVHGSDLHEIGVYAAAATVGGEMLRRGVKPIAVALLHTFCNAGIHWPLLGNSAASLEEITAAALATSCVNVTMATAVLTVMPRRSAMFPSRCRVRWDHLVFVLTPGTLSVAAIGLVVATRTEAFASGVGWGIDTSWRVGGLLIAACLANVALTSRFNAIARRAVRRFWTAQRSKHREGPMVPGELPAEVAPFVIGLSRETNRLRRRIALHDKEKAELQARIERLTQEVAESRAQLETSATRMHKLTRTMEHARARYHALMDQSPDVTIFADSDGVIQSVSRSAMRMLGYQPVELKGKKLEVLIPAGRSSGHRLSVSEKQAKQGAVSLTDTIVRSQGGKEKEVAALVRAFPIHGSYQYAIQLRDTGRMKKALATLKQAKNLTESAHRSRDLFIAAMSHELRTPLHGLIATLDLMRLGSEHCQPELQQRLAIARMSARSLLKIANDVLDLTRIDSGHFTLEQQPFSLGTTIEEIIDESRARAESSDLTLTSRILDPLPPAFMGDPGRLKQILHNLVSNALKFTDTGGVTLQVSYDGERCTVDVVDTGEGVPADKRDSIFEPFVQVESNKRRQIGGTGLGLPISRRLAEAMGGTLTLLRSDSRGSTFRLSVPLPVSKVVPPSEQSQRVYRNPRGRILVVEDNAANRYVAEALLANLECPATIVESGVEAIEVLGRFEFDLILMDCQMPGLDGFETTRRIRQMLSRHVPIIAMTANAMPEDKKECLAAGMDDFLPKPFGCQALHTLLCKWLEPASAARRDAEELEVKARGLPVLDAAVFNELRQSLQWKQEPLRRICTTFTDSAQRAIAALQGKAGEAIDRRAVRRHLHTLLGSAGMVGARQAEYIARRIQGDMQSHRFSENDAALELLKASLERFKREFEQHLQSGSQGTVAAVVNIGR